MRRLRQWLSDLRWFTSMKEGQYRQQLAALKAECADLPKPKQVFEGWYPAPTREEMRMILADAENAAEQRWMHQEREKERQVAMSTPKVRKLQVRGTVHRNGQVDPFLAKQEQTR
jgi:hypothetical protein